MPPRKRCLQRWGQRIGDIRAGSERAFLFSTTLHVAARTLRDREEQAAPISDNALALEDLDEQQQAREVLGALPHADAARAARGVRAARRSSSYKTPK